MHVARLSSRHFGVTPPGLLQARQVVEGVAKVEPGIRVIGPERDGFLEILQALLAPLQPREGDAAVVPHLRQVRRQGRETREILQSRRVLLERDAHRASAVEGFDVVRQGRQDGVVDRQAVSVALQPEQRRGPSMQGVEIGSDAPCGLMVGEGLLKPAHVRLQPSTVVQRASVAGIAGDRPVEAGQGLGPPSQAVEGGAAVAPGVGELRPRGHGPVEQRDAVLEPVLHAGLHAQIIQGFCVHEAT